MTPTISVLMPVYNEEAHVGSAIESILVQTYSDFEFLIVDDGSTDDTLAIIDSFDDNRLRVKHLGQNQGDSAARNAGLEMARGTYIAGMDADDISDPRRLEVQAAFMDAHPGIDICGTALSIFGGTVEETWRRPADHEHIAALLLFESALHHATTILRRETMEECGLRYSEAYEVAQDYHLWASARPHVRFANLPDVLYRYRFDPDARTDDSARKQRYAETIHGKQLRALGISPTKRQLQLHSTMGFPRGSALQSSADVIGLIEWLDLILRQNQTRRVYDQEVLAQTIEEQLREVALNPTLNPISKWQRRWGMLRTLNRRPVRRRMMKRVADCFRQ